MLSGVFKIVWLFMLMIASYHLDAQLIQTGERSHYETDLQQRDFYTDWKGWTSVVLPFKYVNNLIVVDVNLNRLLGLKFIFDTGAEHTILTKREYSEWLGLNFTRKYTIMGADLKTELIAYLAQKVTVKVGPMIALNESILVLEEDYFKYAELTGLDIHGILGADFFRKYIVQIDFDNERITLHKPEHFKYSLKKYEELEIEVRRNKPYLAAKLNIAGDTLRKVKLLMDTGAALPLLLYTDIDTALTIPPNAIPGNVGRGLGGYLDGYKGRVNSLEVSPFLMKDVVTSFQLADSIYVNNPAILNDRNGILGNEVLSRFNIVIDYWHQKVYLRPNKSYKTAFKFDKSGISISASGKNLTQYTVQYITPNSPAAKAGVEKGDILVKINGTSTKLMSMNSIYEKFKKRSGKQIKLMVLRNGTEKKITFQLRDLI